MNIKLIFYCLFSLTCLSLAGCALFSGSERSASFKIQSARYLNPDIQGQAAPIVVTFYQLKKPMNFKQASFTDLNNNPNQILGEDLLDKQSIEVEANSLQKQSFTLSQDTRFIGIVAAYRNISQANWEVLINVGEARHAQYQLDLESQGLSFRENTHSGILP